MAVSLCSPANSTHFCPTFLTSVYFLVLFESGHSDKCELIAHCFSVLSSLKVHAQSEPAWSSPSLLPSAPPRDKEEDCTAPDSCKKGVIEGTVQFLVWLLLERLSASLINKSTSCQS